MEERERFLQTQITRAYETSDIDHGTKERIWGEIRRKRAAYSIRTRSASRFGMAVAAGAGLLLAFVAVFSTTKPSLQRSAGHGFTGQIPKPHLSKVSLAGVGFSPFADPNERLGFVSPEGQWVLLPGDSGHPDLENMNGQRYPVAPAKEPEDIYGQTNDGAVILAYAAGGARLDMAYSPKRGVELRFPVGEDRNAKVAYFASESLHSTWAMLVANRSGAGPGTKTWLDINGRPVNALKSATGSFSWSPKTDTLAVLLQTPAGSRYQLAFYDKNLQRIVASITVPNDNIVADNPQIPRQAIAWSSNGAFVGVGTNHGIYITNAKTFQTSVISPTTRIPDWNWISGNELYVVNHHNEAASIVDFYSTTSLQPLAKVRIPGVIQQEKVVGQN